MQDFSVRLAVGISRLAWPAAAQRDGDVNGLAQLFSFLLAAMGLTVLVVWPEGGPGAWWREKVLRRWLPKPVHGVLDCYICLGFWAGEVLAIPWWFMYHQDWVWFGGLMIAALFWLVMGKWK